MVASCRGMDRRWGMLAHRLDLVLGTFVAVTLGAQGPVGRQGDEISLTPNARSRCRPHRCSSGSWHHVFVPYLYLLTLSSRPAPHRRALAKAPAALWHSKHYSSSPFTHFRLCRNSPVISLISRRAVAVALFSL